MIECPGCKERREWMIAQMSNLKNKMFGGGAQIHRARKIEIPLTPNSEPDTKPENDQSINQSINQ